MGLAEVGEEDRELVTLAVVRRVELAPPYDDPFQIQGLLVSRSDGACGKQQAHRQARHLLEADARRAVQSAEGKIAGDHARDGPSGRVCALQLEFGGMACVNSPLRANFAQGNLLIDGPHPIPDRGRSHDPRWAECPRSEAQGNTVDRDQLRRLLKRVQGGGVSVEDALERIRIGPMDDLGFAKLDLHRAVRRGFPEVVFGPGKTLEQIVAIVRGLRRARQTAVVTRVGPEVHEAVAAEFPKVDYHTDARMLVLRSGRKRRPRPGVVVMSAGTSDQQVTEEAAVTAEVMGSQVVRVHDVGVAGLHRLAAHGETLRRARVLVVVAGMEGALPSVVAGLTDCPVIGVPTSTGYGVGGGGQAALMAMLNSCAAGLTVVNVDNGFGAGFAAAMVNRLGK